MGFPAASRPSALVSIANLLEIKNHAQRSPQAVLRHGALVSSTARPKPVETATLTHLPAMVP